MPPRFNEHGEIVHSHDGEQSRPPSQPRFNERGEIIHSDDEEQLQPPSPPRGGGNRSTGSAWAVLAVVVIGMCALIAILASIGDSVGRRDVTSTPPVVARNQENREQESNQDAASSSQSRQPPSATSEPERREDVEAVRVTEEKTTGVEAPDSVSEEREADDEIERAIVSFHDEMKHLLETWDDSRIRSAAAGDALAARLRALDVLQQATERFGGKCVWSYTRRGIEFHYIELVNDKKAEAAARLDSDGTIFCGSVEHPEYGYTGPVETHYILEKINGRWIVTSYSWED